MPMTKEVRLKLIREIVGKPVPGLIPVGERELQDIAIEEFRLAKEIKTEDENVVDMRIGSGMI